MKMIYLCLAALLGGCAHSGITAGQRPSAPDVIISTAAPAAAASREELLQALGRTAAEQDKAKAAKKDDDFMEIEDKNWLKKTWPMLLFIGLIRLAMGM